MIVCHVSDTSWVSFCIFISQSQERQNQEKEKRGTVKSFQKGDYILVILIIKERSLWAKEEAGVKKRLLQCPGKKRRWQWLLDGEEKLVLILLYLSIQYIFRGQALFQLLRYSSEQSNTESLPS